MNEQSQTRMRGQRFIIAGGGTGGHIFPAIAIANALLRRMPDAQILFIGAKGKMEMTRVPEAGYKILGIDIAGYDRSSMFKNVSLPYKIIKSFNQVKKIMRSFQPDAVIGVGGYSTFPVLRTAQNKGIPTFIHEANSFAGKSNILLGKKATKIFTATHGMERFFPEDKIIVTGNPVRKIIADATISKEKALEFFGLDKNKKTILAIGGSLGAKSINEVFARHINELNLLQIQLIWQTGETTGRAFMERGKSYKNVWVSDFIQDMDKAYAAADVVVSRAGAMSVSELCVAKKAAVFVPYPYAAEDHQTMNAQYLVERNAALMIKDSEAQTKLYTSIITLINDQDRMKELEENIAKYATTNANEIIADEIIKRIEKKDDDQ